MFEAIVRPENLNVIFSDKEYVVENQKLDNDIRYFGKTGSLGFLFFIKNQSFTFENV